MGLPGRMGVGIPACTEADTLGETATAADGTHPTGMHSSFCFLVFRFPFHLNVKTGAMFTKIEFSFSFRHHSQSTYL